MKDKNNIFNIEANYNFFAALLLFLQENYQENFDKLCILLPNRRSCREFKKILAKKNIIKIPQVKAILDISFEDFFQFLPDESVKKNN